MLMLSRPFSCHTLSPEEGIYRIRLERCKLQDLIKIHEKVLTLHPYWTILTAEHAREPIQFQTNIHLI